MFFAACVVAGLASDCADAQVVIGRGSKQLEMAPPAKKKTKTSVPKKDDGKQGVKHTFKLIQVIPRRGNNPFNPIEPINNENGRLVNPNVPGSGTAGPAGGPGGGQGGGGLPQFANYQAPLPNVGYVVLTINPANDSAQLATGSGGGPNTLIFVLNLNIPQLIVGFAVVPSNLQFVPAAPNLAFANDGVQRQFVVRHTPTGNRYRVTFTAGTNLAGGVTLVNFERL